MSARKQKTSDDSDGKMELRNAKFLSAPQGDSRDEFKASPNVRNTFQTSRRRSEQTKLR